jgi:Protein of unknown function (DUF3800)
MSSKIKKLYCYVDETGQDTEGEFFLVALVVTDENRDKLIAEVLRIENDTGKRFAKWRKTSLRKKIEYITAVLLASAFAESLFYAHYKNSLAYMDMSVRSVAAVVKHKQRGDYQATVIVDGLRDVEIPRFAKQLRAKNVKLHKIRGSRDESDALIRLADGVAGFVRDSLENLPYTKELKPLLQKNIQEVK